MRLGKLSLAVAGILAGLTAAAQAAPVIDGMVSAGEYAGAATVHDTTLDADPSNFNQTRYLITDGTWIYYALKLDTPTDTSALPFVNAYLYSGSGQNLVPGPGTGSLDGGDDYIFETGSNGGDVRTFNGPSSTQVGLFTSSTSGTITTLNYAPLNITAALDTSDGDFEMRVPRSVLNADSYDSLRTGAQAWGYNFGTYTTLTPGLVPEPASLGLLGLAATAMIRRRRAAK